jgi:hypothetical protein
VCRRIALFSMKRARQRVSGEEEGGMEEARLVLHDATRLVCVSSQVGSKRPIQGTALSPDSSTLAAADWNGVVSFWAPEGNIRRLKNLQVCTFFGTKLLFSCVTGP